jgi:ethanolamine utilization protein EutQ
MKVKYIKQSNPFIVPTTDGKIIKEHFGNASTKDGTISIAHMIAPPGWSEPEQIPEFDEYIFVIRGKKMVYIDEQEVILSAGESLKVFKNFKVQYSNPFKEEVEYISVCLPAFSSELANKDEDE